MIAVILLFAFPAISTATTPIQQQAASLLLKCMRQPSRTIPFFQVDLNLFKTSFNDQPLNDADFLNGISFKSEITASYPYRFKNEDWVQRTIKMIVTERNGKMSIDNFPQAVEIGLRGAACQLI